MRDLFKEVFIILRCVGKISMTGFSVALRVLFKSSKNQ